MSPRLPRAALVRSCLGDRLRLSGAPASGAGLLLTADHPSLLDGPLLAILVPRPLLFGVDAAYARHPFWRPLLRGWARLTGNDLVALSPASPFALRALARRLEEGGAVCLFPEGGIRRGGTARPWQAGVRFLATRARVWQHATVRGTEAGLLARTPVTVAFGPPADPSRLRQNAAQPEEGSGRVPSSVRSKSSTAMISSRSS